MRTISTLASILALACGLVTTGACGNKKGEPAPGKSTDEPTDVPADTPATPVSPEAADPAGDSGVVGEEVTYEADGVTMNGYLARDSRREGKRPGVLVVHEWWGHNDYARRRARMLAELGYVALAVDMYGDGKQAAHPDEAGAFAGAVMKDREGALARFKAALDLVRGDPATDPDKLAAIGYCFGGGVVLHAARAGIDLDGVVSFHGSLGTETPAKEGEVAARVLVLHGADDPFIPQEQVDKFKAEMDAAKVNYRFVSYPGVTHSFTSPEADEYAAKFKLPIAYDKAADEKSWDEMNKFFAEIFGGAPPPE